MEGEKLSEVRWTLDRIGGGRRKAVRSKADFGQVWGWKGKSCQKQGRLWTGLGVEGEKLSEVRWTLDRFGGGRGKAVRSHENIGQVQG